MTPARVEFEAPVAAPTGQQEAGGGPQGSEKEIPFRFEGTAAEYFNIWIVNIVLTVLTLGIYSAWAKVRTKNYFYRSTYLGDSSFEYRADPIKIMKGRLIVGTLFIAAGISQQFSMTVYGVIMLVFFLCMPAMLTLSAAFNARYSFYRNVSFGFSGKISGAYKALYLGGLIHLLTLGLGFPYMQWMIARYFMGGHRYGRAPFVWNAPAGTFYRVYLRALLFLLPALALGIAAGLSMVDHRGGPLPPIQGVIIGVALALLYLGLLLATGYVQAELANTVFGQTQVGEHRLSSNQSAGAVIWLVLSNALVVAFTFGLMHPWAKVRMTRYRLEHLKLLQRGPLIIQADPGSAAPGPIADAMTDLGDFDFDFGL